MPPRRSPKPVKAVDKPKEPLNTYGFPLVDGGDQFLYDRAAFARKIPITAGAPSRIRLFKRISDVILPGHFEWHDWTERVVNTLCENSLVGFPGCSNSAKTFNVISFACCWWLIDPDVSSVTLVSTSKGSLRRRAWSEVSKCYQSVPGARQGNLIDSRMMWQAVKGDDKHAIIGKAVEEGPTNKVADDIKGVHTRRQMVVIDEATSVPAAIYEACANLYSYPEEFILVLIGNPLNRLDQFGRFCEPADGWTSVNVESGEWLAKPQKDVGGQQPYVVTFDAEKSPNIVEGKIVSKHIPTKEKVEAARRNSGGGQTPLYWQNFRGFWPQEGLTKTVFSESSLIKHDAKGKHKFTGRNFIIIGTFDPAFTSGGDRAVLRFGKLGEIEGGSWGIEAFPPIIIPIDANSTNPVNYQLAEQVKRQCGKFTVNGVDYSCEPENLAVDATGAGIGLCDIMQRTWSPLIMRIQFGGAASEDSTSLEDVRPACEVYLNKTAEMHFSTSNAVNSGQFKGIDDDTAVELCNRIFEDMREDGSSRPKIKLQAKKEYKTMFKQSPDYGDSCVMLTEVARRKGFTFAAVGETVHRGGNWNEQVKKGQEVYADVAYEPEEEGEMEMV